MNKFRHFIPALDSLSNYTRQQFKGDLSAGLAVGIMLIPQGMAYAMIAGLPPIYGLYACIVPILVYAFLGTSRQLAVGPVAMVSLLTASGIGAMAGGGTDLYIILAITLAFLVGLILFLLGVFRLGFLVNFLSHPVISGFTSAAALIIGLSQLKHLIGVPIPRSHHIHEIIGQAIQQFAAINWITFAIGISGILLIIGAKVLLKRVPGQLLAVLFGVLVVWGFALTNQGVDIVGTVPEGLPAFALPSFDLAQWSALLPIAFTIAIVSFMESIAVAKAVHGRHKDYELVPNQELIALGMANIAGSFFQAYPTTGGFSRTAVNDQAGAKTTMASIISAALIILTLLFLTPLFYYLPKAILASIIMVAVFGLIDWKEALHLWKSDRTDFWMLFATFIATLTLGIEAGIGIGVGLSLVMVIFKTTQPHVAILGQVPETPFYRNVDRFKQTLEREDLLIIRFDAQLYFANINFVKETLTDHINQKGASLKAIIFNAESINTIDSSAIHGLEEVLTNAKSKGIHLFFTGVKGPVRDALNKGGLLEKIGLENCFMSIQEAVDYFDQNTKNRSDRFDEYLIQVNS